uniref:Uncharacterized protein n=2 Tax=Oryza TaxID=4527 RepID=A0A0E0P734_ORYRU
MPSPAGGRGGRAAATESRRDDRESLDRSRARGLHYPHLPPLLLRPPFFLKNRWLHGQDCYTFADK